MTHPELPFIIKVCGITNAEDGRQAVTAGATALGFNFYAKSPRFVTPQQAKHLIESIPGSYLRVGVFVNATASELEATAQLAALDVLQLHGTLPEPLPPNTRLWRALPAGTLPERNSAFEAYLLDTPYTGFGGSGRIFDWNIAANFPAPFLLAGGLHSDNVAAAVEAAHPCGVDACSRLEISPGRKNAALVRAFVQAAAQAHRSPLAHTLTISL